MLQTSFSKAIFYESSFIELQNAKTKFVILSIAYCETIHKTESIPFLTGLKYNTEEEMIYYKTEVDIYTLGMDT